MDDIEKTTRPTRILLVRHAANDWVDTGRLAGRTPGIHLNQKGLEQAHRVAERLARQSIKAIFASPRERAIETAEIIAQHCSMTIEISTAIDEVDMGDWTGRLLKELASDPAWNQVQTRPSGFRFPQGERMRSMQERSVEHVEYLAAQYSGETLVLVSHADVIKAILAHFIGLHLDLFQRVIIEPASISILSFSETMIGVQTINDTAHLA